MMNAQVVVAETGEIVIRLPQADQKLLQAILNRVHGALRDSDTAVDQLVLGDNIIDFNARRVVSAGPAIHLTAQEFDLLKYLAARSNATVTRDELLRDVWKYADTPMTRSVDNAIARLRKKIEPCPQRPRFLHTVHGDGYSLAVGAMDHAESA